MTELQKCFLCLTPYRNEVLKALSQGISSTRVYEKYKPLMGYDGSLDGFRQVVWRHRKQGHKSEAYLVAPLQGEKKKTANLDSLVTKLTELAAVKIENMSAEELQLRDVFQGHRTLIEYRKLKLGEDAMLLALGKMFGPKVEGKVVEGEVVNDGVFSPGRIADGGVEPQNPQ